MDRNRPASPSLARPGFLRAYAYPALVGLVGLAATATVTWAFHATSEARDAERFQRLIDQRVEETENRLETYVALLRATAGFFAGNPQASNRAAFRAYVGRLNVGEYYSGVQGIGFVEAIAPGEVGAVEARLRADGADGFALRPPGPRDAYSAITLIEPMDRRNQAALGFDMYSEATRRTAMARARDEGAAALSGRVQLVQEIDPDKQPGFLIFVPVYRGGGVPEAVEERRAALVGWAYAPFRATDLFTRDFFADIVMDASEIRVGVYDGAAVDPASLLFDTAAVGLSPAAEDASDLVGSRTTTIAGHPWTFRFETEPGFALGSNRGLVPYLGGLGLLATLVLTAGAAAQARARHQAEAARLALQGETERLERLNAVGAHLASELNSEKLGAAVVEAATALTGAAYGALFERVPAGQDGSLDDAWHLSSLTGAPREAFARFAPTFAGEGPVRADDVAADPRFGSHGGLLKGHLPVRSYLAVPVVAASGERLGALLFGHPEPGRFTLREERLAAGIAGQAAVALDNARLFGAVQREVAERRRAEEELTESNDELQRYAYIVSHDLRAPLVNVMGFTGVLEEAQSDMRAALKDHPDAARIDEDMSEALGFIKAAITKMEGLIAAILKLSREGRRTFRPEPLDMDALMTGLAAAQRHQFDAAGATVEIAPGLPSIEADRLAVEQIFANLLDNALKYRSEERPPEVRIEAHVDARDRAVFTVTDNGRGIAPQDHRRIFELFRRSGKQDKPGEGIGLAHVKALVRVLGGRITVSSELGRGTRFTIALPRKAAGLASASGASALDGARDAA
ncbi:CHASE domain-containing sensor histidine kinase [Antarcticirhabdus aurantiaca]|uniref:CHASE domain-containing protein n=1 Tax=Antarcticirhabdus aurantiaca TaxID=2606717 RepID=A0ACD4NPC6_9HYPH|nr:CHASE domain-containing protein [Antarcticirhabdus aurantiaca]WAJ28663.1 CHASE domain-containing protein [Jeongeuplla avenae]